MNLKNKAAASYLLPLLLSYVGIVSALSFGSGAEWTDLVGAALPASAILIACHLLQDILSKPLKEFLVFYRKSDRLPGHRAFTQVCLNDARIPPAFLVAKLGTIGCSGNEQNAEWYAMYRQVASERAVEHENFRYLAWRDATATLVLLAVFTPLFRAFGQLRWENVFWVSLGCVGLSILTATAARNAASSLVRNVVAIVATGSTQSPME